MKNKISLLILTASSSLIISFNAFAATLQEGISLYNSGQYDKAAEVFNNIAKENPKSSEPHLWLSKSYEANLDLEKSLSETQIYHSLKYQEDQLKKAEIKVLPSEQPLENNDSNTLNDNSLRVIHWNESSLREIMSKRNPDDQVRNLKFLDLKSLKKLFSDIPSDSEALIRNNGDYKIKYQAGIATHQDLILLNRTNADLIALNIETKKYERDQEQDINKKKILDNEIERLSKDYNANIDQTIKLINQAVYENTDPTTYEYFIDSGVDADSYIKNTELKKVDLMNSINDVSQVIRELKKSVPLQEKELTLKRSKINGKLFSADINTLLPVDKETVNNYNTLSDQASKNKDRLYNYVIEQNNLISAYKKFNETIKKIKPKYIFKDPALPKE
ncbi:MAG: hypothetical protein H7263_18810, partial [Candidatus Sericytochromatia bacterium]|nr:hypothetical protein [Candidatus Sericytochromatia bacterium]